MAKRRVTVELEDVESMLGELADTLDRQGKVTAEEVAAVDPVARAEAEAKRPITRRERITRYFSAPRLGWPLTILLWLIILDSLYAVITWFWSSGNFFSVQHDSADDLLYQLQDAGMGLFYNILPIARIAAVFMLFKYKSLGFILITVASLVWMVVMYSQFEPFDEQITVFYTRESGFLIVLYILVMMKWHELD